MIDLFEKELRKRVQERDPNADVKIFKTMSTPLTGEYTCLIETLYKTEEYTFNPQTGDWIRVFHVK